MVGKVELEVDRQREKMVRYLSSLLENGSDTHYSGMEGGRCLLVCLIIIEGIWLGICRCEHFVYWSFQTSFEHARHKHRGEV